MVRGMIRLVDLYTGTWQVASAEASLTMNPMRPYPDRLPSFGETLPCEHGKIMSCVVFT